MAPEFWPPFTSFGHWNGATYEKSGKRRKMKRKRARQTDTQVESFFSSLPAMDRQLHIFFLFRTASPGGFVSID
jgi:hypothetical protein